MKADSAPDLDREVAAVAPRYRMRLGGPRFRGRLGGLRGFGSGGAEEFYDFRDYVPGDDVRHLDWRGYARTEQLRIRLYEAEVAPRLDVLVDTSASMSVSPTKVRALRLLARAIGRWSDRHGASVRVLALGGGEIDLDAEPCDRKSVMPAMPEVALGSSGVRVLLTDGLWPEAQTAFLRRVLATDGRCFVLQLLDAGELEPDPDGVVTLLDVETGRRAEVSLDAGSLARYRERLSRLCDALRDDVVGLGGHYARVGADRLEAMCRRDLLPAGVVEPA